MVDHAAQRAPFGFEQLGEEPRNLQNEVLRLEQEINELSVKHYKVHIDNSRCVGEVTKCTKVIAQSSQQISDAVPKLQEEIARFRTVGAEISDAHQRNRQTLNHHSELIELLEIPQLMDTCVRNSLYSEALELRTFANTLLLRHRAIAAGLQKAKHEEEHSRRAESGKGITIIESIVKDVDISARSMRKQLLHQLKGKVSLLTSLKLISNLRRLDAQTKSRGSESEHKEADEVDQEALLRVEFLECRDVFLTSLAQDFQMNRAYQSLVTLIKRNRESWFDTVTQYRTIFTPEGEDSSNDDQGILSQWIAARVNEFLHKLNETLPLVEDAASIANLLDQSMYFGASLARVGADFRPLLIPIFANRIETLMEEFWTVSFQQAEALIESGEWGSPLPMPNANATLLATSARTASNDAGGGEEKTEVGGDRNVDLSPPNILLSFPVVASLVNGILASLNELRNCAAVIIGKALGEKLVKYLERIPTALRAYRHGRPKEVLAETQQRYNELCTLFASTFLPYIRKCFDSVFELSGNYSTLALKSKDRVVSFVPIDIIQDDINALPIYPKAAEVPVATDVQTNATEAVDEPVETKEPNDSTQASSAIETAADPSETVATENEALRSPEA